MRYKTQNNDMVPPRKIKVSRYLFIGFFFLLINLEAFLLWFTANKDEASKATDDEHKLPRIVFGGIMRDMNRKSDGYLHYYIPKLLALAENITSEFHIVIYENDSTDGTRQVLRQYFEKKDYATLIFEDNALDANNEGGQILLSRTRTTRIAHARNRILNLVEQRFPDFDYFAMTDMDGICGGANMSLSFDPNVFKYALTELKDQWDALTFRFEPYYDLWAFRHESLAPKNFWHGGKQSNTINDPHEFKKIFDNVSWPDGLIPVQSSFGMFGLYNMSFIRRGTARYRGMDEKNKSDCEHVAFHRDLTEKLGARMRMSPLVYCQGDDGYQSLPDNITSKLL